VERFRVKIEASNWEDFEVIELPRPPAEGQPLETKYGTCIVTRVELVPDDEPYAGSIYCRLP
jgi:hypothetical protein